LGPVLAIGFATVKRSRHQDCALISSPVAR